MEHKEHSLAESFRHAINGIGATVRRERNMRIHVTVAGLVVIAGAAFRISAAEWLVCLIFFGLVMGLELMNTALECAIDLVTEDKRPLAKLAKDAAAGGVLIAAVFAAVSGLMIFVPKAAALFFGF